MTFRTIRCLAVIAALLPFLAGCGSPEQKEALYLRQGNALFEKGEFEKARVEYKNAARAKPSDVEPLYRMALVDEAEGDLRNAVGGFLAVEQQDSHFLPAKLKVAQYLIGADQRPPARERIQTVLSQSPDNAEGHALSAALLLREHNLDEADKEAHLALQLDPANISACAALTGLYVEKKEFDKALTTVDDGLTRNPGSIPLLMLRIMVYASKDDLQGIAATYQIIFKLKPEAAQFRADLAGIYLKAGKIDEAETTWRNAVAARPDDWNMKHDLVVFLGDHRGVDAAEKEIHGLMETYPDNDQLYFWLADIYTAHNATDKALTLLNQLIERGGFNPSALTARAMMARIQFRHGDKELAEQLASAVLAKAPDNAEALTVRANLAFEDGDYAGAASILRTVLARSPGSRDALQLLGETLLRQGRYDLAIDTQEKLVDADPSNTAARIRLAQMIKLNGDSRKAIALITQIVKEAPGNPVAWETAARFAIDTHQWLLADQAIHALDKIEGQHLTAAFLEGQTLQANGKNEDAIGKFSEIASADPTTPLAEHALTSLASDFSAMGRTEAACRYLESLKTDSAFVATLLGQCYKITGKLAESAQQFDKAITAKASFQDPYLDRADLYAKDGKPDLAIGTLKLGAAMAPGDNRAPMAEADLLAAAGKYQDAVALYDRILDRDPGNDKAANNLAELIADYDYDNAASLDRARRIAERFAGSTDPIPLDTLAWVYFRQGDIPLAETTIKRVISAQGAELSPQVHYHYASILMKAGRVDEAQAELRLATVNGANYPGLETAKSMMEKR